MINRRLFLASAVLAGCAIALRPAMAQDPVKVASETTKIKLENAHVRVLEYTSKPGQKDPMHSHPSSLICVISGGKFKSTSPDGKSSVLEYKAGDVAWREALTHSGENVGTTDLDVIVVEFKKPAKMK
ncbi:MAG TPA: cytoplasmic protein [Bacteroidota bacterium]|nr:cytoplasmic protein [Bacteroidota bacterium]